MYWFLDLLKKLHYTFFQQHFQNFQRCPRILQLHSSCLKKERKKKDVLVHVRADEQSTISSFLPPVFPCVGSQHWSNLILDLRDQHLGQHDASNLEDRGSHFKLQSTLLWVCSLRHASQSPFGRLLQYCFGTEGKHYSPHQKIRLWYITGINATMILMGFYHFYQTSHAEKKHTSTLRPSL